MRKLFVGILTIFSFTACQDDILVDESLNVHNHDHTHTVLLTNGFPEMVIPADNPLTKEGMELGRKLFYDPILSADNSLACAGCHQQEHAFADPNQFSVGIHGIAGEINASALINAGWQNSFFWDGRAKTLEEQALEPVINPIEMAFNWPDAVQRLKLDSAYKAAFELAFPDEPLNETTVAKALAQFQRSLISNQSKFDLFMDGNATFTELEIAGFNLFMSEKAECFHCHNRPLFTDNELHNNGLDVDPDPGLGDVTGNARDIGKFRSPTLRNIEFTAPYMHDGRFATLEDVIDFYSEGIQSHRNVSPLLPNDRGGFNLTSLEKRQLVAFLKTLSDTAFINNPAFSNPFQ